jgi:hypothetical protein
LEDPAMHTFITWVKSKPPGFSGSAKESRQSFRPGR